MDRDKLIEEMLTAKADKNNTIDLNAYGNGLADMYDRLVKLFAIPDVIDTVCDCAVEDFKPDWENNKCKNCGKIIEY